MEDSLKSFWGMAATIVEGAAGPPHRKIWMHFTTWLLLGLEFELAADVIRTAIAPTWLDIGQLASSPQSVRFSATFSIKTLKRCPIQEKAPIKVALKVAALSPYPRHLLLEPVDQTSANLPRNHQHWRVHGTI